MNKKLLEKARVKNDCSLTKISNFNHNTYIKVHNDIESRFHDAIAECYCNFTEISCPILHRHDILSLIDDYKTKLLPHYEMTKKMFGFDKKENLSQNEHLIKSRLYDRIVFYQFLIQSRIRFNH